MASNGTLYVDPTLTWTASINSGDIEGQVASIETVAQDSEYGYWYAMSLAQIAQKVEPLQAMLDMINAYIKTLEIKKIARFLISAPTQTARIYFWEKWVSNTETINAYSLSAMANAMRSQTPEVQIVVMKAWARVVNLNMYAHADIKRHQSAFVRGVFLSLVDIINGYDSPRLVAPGKKAI